MNMAQSRLSGHSARLDLCVRPDASQGEAGEERGRGKKEGNNIKERLLLGVGEVGLRGIMSG